MSTPAKERAARIYAEVITGKRKPMSKGAIMKEVGYSEAVQKNPGVVMNKGTFPELIKELLPPNFIIDEHKKLFDAENENVRLGAVKLGYEVSGAILNRHAHLHKTIPPAADWS